MKTYCSGYVRAYLPVNDPAREIPAQTPFKSELKVLKGGCRAVEPEKPPVKPKRITFDEMRAFLGIANK